MSGSQRVVRLRGKDVLFREGDLAVTHSSFAVGFFVALINGGYSHVCTVVKVKGELMLVSVCSSAWVDAKGQRWPAGVTVEPLETLDDPVYTALWRVTPRVPRTEAQLSALRLAATEMIRCDDHTGSSYDDGWEFCHSFLGIAPASTDRWHCAEMTSVLAKCQGGWREGLTTSMSIPQVIAEVGEPQRIF